MKQTRYLALALAIVVAGIFLMGRRDVSAAGASSPPPLRVDAGEDHCKDESGKTSVSPDAGCTRVDSAPGKQDCCGG